MKRRKFLVCFVIKIRKKETFCLLSIRSRRPIFNATLSLIAGNNFSFLLLLYVAVVEQFTEFKRNGLYHTFLLPACFPPSRGAVRGGGGAVHGIQMLRPPAAGFRKLQHPHHPRRHQTPRQDLPPPNSRSILSSVLARHDI